MIELFAIVSLTKPKYNKLGYNPEIDGEKPRLLVVKIVPRYRQYLVKYPNGKTFYVNESDITPKGVFNVDHIKYSAIAKTLRAVTLEFKHNERYANLLAEKKPQLAIDLTQKIEAKQQRQQEAVYIEPPSLDTLSAPPPVQTVTDEQIYNVLLGLHEVMWKLLRKLDE